MCDYLYPKIALKYFLHILIIGINATKIISAKKIPTKDVIG